jgi:predicted nucleic acid-binding protein
VSSNWTATRTCRKTLLSDVNVWLALIFNAHAHHPAALAWFNSLSGAT